MALENVFIWKGWECDVFIINKNYYTEEYEVKVSRSDFKAEFRMKEEKHRNISNGNGPNRFWFVCPKDLIKPEDVPDYAGLKYCMESGMQKYLKIIVRAPQLHTNKVDDSLWKHLAIKLYWKLNR